MRRKFSQSIRNSSSSAHFPVNFSGRGIFTSVRSVSFPSFAISIGGRRGSSGSYRGVGGKVATDPSVSVSVSVSDAKVLKNIVRGIVEGVLC